MLTRTTVGLWLLGVVLGTSAPAPAAAPEMTLEVKVNGAQFIMDTVPTPTNVIPNALGKGIDGAFIWGNTELRYTCKDLPEGDYFVAFLVSADDYFTFAEVVQPRTEVYVNDTRLPWTGHTEPRRAPGAPAKTYQTELLAGKAHVKPGDVLRMTGCNIMVGPLRLYRQSPPAAATLDNKPYADPPLSNWLKATWADTQRDGQTVRQGVKLFNPGVLSRTFTLKAQGRDYVQRALLDKDEQVTVAPGQSVVKTFEFKPGDSGRARLCLTASAPGFWPDVRLSKFWVDDAATGARRSLLLSGEWEVCFLPGADPGQTPPADAKWEKVNVPCDIPGKKGHCAWFRKGLDAPVYLTGERIVLKCNEILSTATVYLNGQRMGYENRGSEPFEMDVTAGFKPGQKNEILIAVQDWLAYSPRNRERLAAGEAPIFKDSMLNVADYDSAEQIGIRGPLWLVTRPAVSVDDVFVATSVRQKKLTLRYRLANTSKTDSEVTLTPQVLEAGEAIKTLPPVKVAVPAGKTAVVTVEQPWADAKYWWPDDPHLYVLQTSLSGAAGATDVHLQRFGFRELWIDGIAFVLNGVPVKLRACCVSGGTGKYNAAPHWQQDQRYAAIFDHQRLCREQWQIQVVRTHLCSRFEEGVDLADESGVIMKFETGFHQQNFTLNKQFWENAMVYELHCVDLYKNHPSVMMWSGGNENMWGIIYQGEVAKTVFNDFQVRVANAIQAFDLMCRPVEWEADGDLFGGGKHYALHYPRELNAFPDLPNSAFWGPLDGKTVIPYSMGPITLGSKPLTVGESYWPANLSHPFGETILLGDQAYLGGNYQFQAWVDSSQFFLSGFRDVEFAVIDTYLPRWTIRPQEVVAKEETTCFYGGRTIQRDLNVHNDVMRPAKLSLVWSLTAPGGNVLAQGRQEWQAFPSQLKRLVLEVPLPAVTATTAATWRVELFDGDKSVDVLERLWRLFAPPALKVPAAGLTLAVYDPPGATAALLKQLGVPLAPVSDLSAIPAGASLLIGQDALKQPPQGQWREALAAFVRKGGKAAILAQGDTMDFLPVPLTQNKDRKATIAFLRAGDHPVMAGLTDADLKWWADDHYVSTGNFRKPHSGNYLPLAEAGTMEGTVESPLLEEYDGGGSYILCQFLLADKALVAPPATMLLGNLLNYLASPGTFRSPGQTALLIGGNKTLKTALDASHLDGQDLTGKLDQLTAQKFAAAIVDGAALDASMVAPLGAFAQAGGRVMVWGARPDKQALIESLLGIHLTLTPLDKEPNDVQNRILRTGDSGLLSGISNHEFFWGGREYLELLRREGWWFADCGPRKPQEYIADYFCLPAEADSAKARCLTRPCALLEVPSGKGCFVVNQLRLDQPLTDLETTASRLQSLLLTNLGCRLISEGGGERARLQRLASYQFKAVDLAAYGNRGLTENKAAGIVGWSNQGENDLRGVNPGPQTLAGVPFTVAPGKSAIGLYCKSGVGNLDLPKEVKGIKVGAKADMLFFLHVASYLGGGKDVCVYRMNYADGTSVEQLIENGRQIFDWWSDPIKYVEDMTRASTVLALRCDNPMHKGLCVLCYEWANPHPEKEIAGVDFAVAPQSDCSAIPFLIGLTAATLGSNEGVVEDIIGTAGVKVRLGNQLKEFYYIGVVGIDAKHPFYEKALAAHRAMAVGQKVTVFLGEMPKTADGRTMAYVCLGKDISDVNNMLNTRVLGDGLGKVGNFEGNGRHRMFMENLGFITEQGKKGMFAEKK